MKTKYKYIFLNTSNFIKTILMLLVILQHATALWVGWFNQRPVFPSDTIKYFSEIVASFHIYSFVMVSGYIYAHLKYEENKYSNFKLLIKNKFKRLIVPYIFISLFWGIPFSIYYFGINLKRIFIDYFLGCSPSQFWFLLMLFNIFIIIYFIGDLIYFSYFKGIFLSILIYIFGIFIGKIFPNIYQVERTFDFFIYFVIGMFIYKSDLYILKKISSYIYVLIFIFLQILKHKFLIPNSNIYIYI